jgi:hypothetical protein
MKQTASGWVILTRKLVAGFHPQNDTPGCKDLIDVIRLEANWKTFFDCYGKLTYRPESAESSCAENAMQFECNSIEFLPQSQTDFSASQITRCDLTG